MGNIEIKQDNSRPKRTQIFSDRNSLTPTKSYLRSSLTPNNKPQIPIRYANKSSGKGSNILTQRKANTSRLDSSRLDRNLRYSPSNSSNMPEQLIKNSFSKLKTSKQKTIQLLNENQEIQYQKSLNLSGRIIPNSNRNKKNKYQDNLTQQNFRNQQELRNPLENRQIIKKVRNFNDFLNQIKKKLKQDKQKALQRKNSYHKYSDRSNLQKLNFSGIQTDRIPQNHQHQFTFDEAQTQRGIPKNKSTRILQVALKLENQKVELQKYKRLVQRQLSKNHSIENISLCTKNSRQKILTIQYQSLLPQYVYSNENSKRYLHRQVSEKETKKKIENVNVNQKLQMFRKRQKQNPVEIKSIEDQSLNLLKRLKIQYNQTMKNMLQLGKQIQYIQNQLQQQQNKPNQPDRTQTILIKQQNQSLSEDLDQADYFQKIDIPIISQKTLIAKQNRMNSRQESKKVETDINIQQKETKIQKIEGLFKKLTKLQSQYQDTDRQIRDAISVKHKQEGNQQSSSYSEYLSEAFQQV